MRPMNRKSSLLFTTADDGYFTKSRFQFSCCHQKICDAGPIFYSLCAAHHFHKGLNRRQSQWIKLLVLCAWCPNILVNSFVVTSELDHQRSALTGPSCGREWNYSVVRYRHAMHISQVRNPAIHLDQRTCLLSFSVLLFRVVSWCVEWKTVGFGDARKLYCFIFQMWTWPKSTMGGNPH